MKGWLQYEDPRNPGFRRPRTGRNGRDDSGTDWLVVEAGESEVGEVRIVVRTPVSATTPSSNSHVAPASS